MIKKKAMAPIIILALLAVVVFGVIVGGIFIAQNIGKSSEEISSESAIATLDRLYRKINPAYLEPIKGNVDLDVVNIEDSLPDISKYPPQVDNATEDFVEIFSSTEKAGTGTDAWLVDVANAFNASGASVGGKPVSVRIRGIASGVGKDYIASKKYLPDAYSPSNELWGAMLEELGTEINLVEKRLAGNVAGVLFTRQKQSELIQQYGAVNLKTVIEAVKNDEIAMGYTNPLASSAGLNFLVSTLYTFDKENPLSEDAVSEFESFQTNIPFVAYTTLQMRESAKSGALDGFILEYQSYSNLPEIKSTYTFTPYGVRHDSPVYEIGALSDTKKEILRQFIAFCKQDQFQTLASEYGFNGMDDYQEELGVMNDGGVILAAQKIWKEKKHGVRDIAAVFVADISGSMEGVPLNRLKESLLKGSRYIGNNNYIGLVTFSDRVNVDLPIGKFDLNQRSMFTGAVENMQAGGGTAMYDAIAVAAKMLVDEQERNPNAKLMLFVLTDGETNRGHSLKDIRGPIETLGIPIYTIGYNADISVLETISNINEAASINADTDDVVYILENLFNAQM